MPSTLSPEILRLLRSLQKWHRNLKRNLEVIVGRKRENCYAVSKPIVFQPVTILTLLRL
jgi:hypothetical protein